MRSWLLLSLLFGLLSGLRLRLVLVALLAACMVHGQENELRIAAPAPPPVQAVTVKASATGNAAYCYWVVVTYPSGNALPGGPSCTSVTFGTVTVTWTPMPGATSYDVLRTAPGASLPSGAAAIAVATGVTGASATDSGGALSSYTVSTAAAVTSVLTLNNRDASLGRLDLSIGGANVMSLLANSSAGGPVLGINDTGPSFIGSVQHTASIYANVGAAPAGLQVSNSRIAAVQGWVNVPATATTTGSGLAGDFYGITNSATTALIGVSSFGLTGVNAAYTFGANIAVAGCSAWTGAAWPPPVKNCAGSDHFNTDLVGLEIDMFNRTDGVGHTGQATGLWVNNVNSSDAATKFDGVLVESSATAAAKWGNAFRASTGAATVGMLLAALATGASQASMPLQFVMQDSGGVPRVLQLSYSSTGQAQFSWANISGGGIGFYSGAGQVAGINNAGHLGLVTAPTSTSPLHIGSLPTSSAGLASGDVWSNAGVLTVVP